MNPRIAERDDARSRPGRDPYWIESLARGLAVLAAFSAARPELGLADVAEHARVTKASALRIGYTLTELGYLSRNPATRGYRLGAKALSLGLAALSGLAVRDIARPYVEALASATGQIVNLSALDDTEIVYIDRIASAQLISINLGIGSRLPAYCTSMGRAMLAFLPERDARSILERTEWRPFTSHTPTSVDDLMADLAQVRARGYAVNNQELALGHRSAAAALLNADGEPVGAINVSVPSELVSLEQLESEYVPAVIDTCRQVSALLGPRVGQIRIQRGGNHRASASVERASPGTSRER